ncbi:MAG: hypothetical protein U0835_02655 [Isosphaeraceae bacterium]
MLRIYDKKVPAVLANYRPDFDVIHASTQLVETKNTSSGTDDSTQTSVSLG